MRFSMQTTNYINEAVVCFSYVHFTAIILLYRFGGMISV